MSYHPRMVCHGTLAPAPPEPTPATPDLEQQALDRFHAMQAEQAKIAAQLRAHTNPTPTQPPVGASINTSTATPIGAPDHGHA